MPPHIFTQRLRLSLIVISVLIAVLGKAQKKDELPDTRYYFSYDTTVTGRVYLSQKYVSMVLSGGDSTPPLRYRPNSQLSLGVGATYGWLTINGAFAMGFLNPGDAGKDKTKTIDLQAHLYGQKMTVDLFGQYYKGFYLFPKGTATGNTGKNWYTRPDISLLQLGISAYYIFNWKKFSNRAAFLQNEWQTRPAGSFLLGGEIYYGQAKADSAFVPSVLSASYKNASTITQMQYGDVAVGAGYAYTLVLHRHWFATASLTGSLSFDLLKEWEQDGKTSNNFSFRPNYAYKAGIGYNSRRFTTSLSWVNNSITTNGNFGKYRMETGNARLHVAYRFHTTTKIRKVLKPFRKLPL